MHPDSPSLQRIRELLTAMQGAPVLVLGDLMLDVYLSGGVDRISPEGPVPVVSVRERSARLGAAGNVALNIKALGGTPRLVALMGGDEAGRELATLLAERDMPSAGLVLDPERPSTVKTRVLGAGQQICRYDVEDARPVAGEALTALHERSLAALAGARAVLLSDYGKGVLADELVEELVREAGRRGIPVVVDPKEGHFSAYRGVDLVTPNRAEAGGSFGIPIRSEGDLETVGRGLLERLGAKALMITLGEDGIALFRPGEDAARFPARARQVYDVTGAGDTVVTVLALTLAAGGSLEEGAVLANHAAGLVVGRVGTAAVEAEQLLGTFMDEILGETAGDGEGELLDREDAASWAERVRKDGRRIVFTNGCFDILHFGHYALLNEAARQGDLLVVGVNSDESVRRLKGPSRPVNGLAERARLLAHLRSVDAVVPFAEDTPLELIRELRPDILVKGDEYDEVAIVGADEVKSWGGTVYRFPMQQGYSTTSKLAATGRAESAPDSGKGKNKGKKKT